MLVPLFFNLVYQVYGTKSFPLVIGELHKHRWTNRLSICDSLSIPDLRLDLRVKFSSFLHVFFNEGVICERFLEVLLNRHWRFLCRILLKPFECRFQATERTAWMSAEILDLANRFCQDSAHAHIGQGVVDAFGRILQRNSARRAQTPLRNSDTEPVAEAIHVELLWFQRATISFQSSLERLC